MQYFKRLWRSLTSVSIDVPKTKKSRRAEKLEKLEKLGREANRAAIQGVYDTPRNLGVPFTTDQIEIFDSYGVEITTEDRQRTNAKEHT
jgi:hypothetical protein